MATPRSQRIGIWIIAIVLMLGTLGSFLVMGLSVNNQKADEARKQKNYEDYIKVMTEYQTKVKDQTKELSDKYYSEFNSYSSLAGAFTGSDVKELLKNDLKVGDGAEVTAKSEYNAYYIGWNPKGIIFDQSIEAGALKEPISSGNFITGWNEGVLGMKIGGIREITIPSDKAYGQKGSGDNIPPNTPIKFIVMLIPKITPVPQPDLTRFIQAS